MIIFLLIFVFTFSLFIIQKGNVHATGASDTSALEPESGTLNGNVSIGNDINASNQQYIIFNPSAIATPTPVSQLVISNIVIADTNNANKFSLQNNIQIGNVLFGDRTYTITALPPSFVGNQWIRTANNSKKWNAGASLLSFTINKQATVSVGIDQRVAIPSWIDATWNASGLKLIDNEKHPVSFIFFQKTFPTGTVALGPNAANNNSNMYLVIIQ